MTAVLGPPSSAPPDPGWASRVLLGRCGRLVARPRRGLDPDLGRDRDHTVQGSAGLPDLDQAVGVGLAHSVELEANVDRLKPRMVGRALDP